MSQVTHACGCVPTSATSYAPQTTIADTAPGSSPTPEVTAAPAAVPAATATDPAAAPAPVTQPAAADQATTAAGTVQPTGQPPTNTAPNGGPSDAATGVAANQPAPTTPALAPNSGLIDFSYLTQPMASQPQASHGLPPWYQPNTQPTTGTPPGTAAPGTAYGGGTGTPGAVGGASGVSPQGYAPWGMGAPWPYGYGGYAPTTGAMQGAGYGPGGYQANPYGQAGPAGTGAPMNGADGVAELGDATPITAMSPARRAQFETLARAMGGNEQQIKQAVDQIEAEAVAKGLTDAQLGEVLERLAAESGLTPDGKPLDGSGGAQSAGATEAARGGWSDEKWRPKFEALGLPEGMIVQIATTPSTDLELQALVDELTAVKRKFDEKGWWKRLEATGAAPEDIWGFAVTATREKLTDAQIEEQVAAASPVKLGRDEMTGEEMLAGAGAGALGVALLAKRVINKRALAGAGGTAAALSGRAATAARFAPDIARSTLSAEAARRTMAVRPDLISATRLRGYERLRNAPKPSILNPANWGRRWGLAVRTASLRPASQVMSSAKGAARFGLLGAAGRAELAAAGGLRGIASSAIKAPFTKAGLISAGITIATEIPNVIATAQAEGGWGRNTSRAAGGAVGKGVGFAVGWAGGAKAGAIAGATIGSLAGPVGTLIGGGIGAVAGGLAGSALVGEVGSKVGEAVGGAVHGAVEGATNFIGGLFGGGDKDK